MSLKAAVPCARSALVALIVLAYFVVFPGDVKIVLTPIVAVVEFLKIVLELTKSVSAALYGVIAVAIIAWAVVRVWGGRRPGAGAAA